MVLDVDYSIMMLMPRQLIPSPFSWFMIMVMTLLYGVDAKFMILRKIQTILNGSGQWLFNYDVDQDIITDEFDDFDD